MKALVFEAPDKPVVAEMPMPELKDNEVLVHTAAIGICHSDYELLAGRYIIPITYPVGRATNGPAKSSKSANR